MSRSFGVPQHDRWRLPATLLGLLLFIPTGCTHPSAANIELRKQNTELREQIADLNRRHDADVATIKGLESRSGATTAPALDQLFTVYGIQLGRLTGGADLDPDRPGDEGLKIYLTPIDADGQQIKSAGAIAVEAFDLSDNGKRVARCTYPLEQARKNWYGQAMMYAYVVTCTWESPPLHADVTVKVTFTDALTQRVFETQKVVKVRLPTAAPTTQSAAAPAAR